MVTIKILIMLTRKRYCIPFKDLSHFVGFVDLIVVMMGILRNVIQIY